MKSLSHVTKLVACIVLFGFLFAPSITSAQFDQRCWTKTECEATRQRLLIDKETQSNEGAFVSNSETEKVCGGKTNAEGKELGFCKPIGGCKRFCFNIIFVFPPFVDRSIH